MLRSNGHTLVACPQNIAEFWNVCTRPATARGGLGLSHDETYRRLRLVERIAQVIPDHPDEYLRWRTIVVEHRVSGVQVHDARLVAFMEAQGITHLVTLNAADFRRYTNVVIIEPAGLIPRAKP